MSNTELRNFVDVSFGGKMLLKSKYDFIVIWVFLVVALCCGDRSKSIYVFFKLDIS